MTSDIDGRWTSSTRFWGPAQSRSMRVTLTTTLITRAQTMTKRW